VREILLYRCACPPLCDLRSHLRQSTVHVPRHQPHRLTQSRQSGLCCLIFSNPHHYINLQRSRYITMRIPGLSNAYETHQTMLSFHFYRAPSFHSFAYCRALRLVSAVRMGDTMSATFPFAAVGTRCVASGDQKVRS
jgi:hypothetical protein